MMIKITNRMLQGHSQRGAGGGLAISLVPVQFDNEDLKQLIPNPENKVNGMYLKSK